MGIINDINSMVKHACMSKKARAPFLVRRKRMAAWERPRGMWSPNASKETDLTKVLGYKALQDPSLREKENRINDPYYFNILVGGANAAGKGFFGLSQMPFGVAMEGDNHAIFRHNQEEDIKKAISVALGKGLHPRVFGHSWGGATVARLAELFPGVPMYALDPTSWTGRIDRTPKNLTICRPYIMRDGNTVPGMRDKPLGELAPVFGGRWPRIDKGEGHTLEYVGSHVNGLDEAVDEIIRTTMEKRIGKTPPAPTPKDNGNAIR